MPPLPNVPGVVKVAFLWDDGTDDNVSTTIHWSYTGGPPDNAECLSLATAINTASNPLLAFLLGSSAKRGVEVTDLSSATGGSGALLATAGGTATGQILGGQVAALTSYHIARKYRGGKPRSYWPFGSSNFILNAQQWTTTFIANVDSALTTMFAAITGLTAGSTVLTTQANVSYYNGFTVVIDPVTGRARNLSTRRATPLVDLVTGHVTRQALATQRRRA